MDLLESNAIQKVYADERRIALALASHSNVELFDSVNGILIALRRYDGLFRHKVTPHFPDAWIDYEIPFNRHFYVFQPPHQLAEFDVDLKVVTDRILRMFRK